MCRQDPEGGREEEKHAATPVQCRDGEHGGGSRLRKGRRARKRSGRQWLEGSQRAERSGQLRSKPRDRSGPGQGARAGGWGALQRAHPGRPRTSCFSPPARWISTARAALGEAVVGSKEPKHLRVLLDDDVYVGAAALLPHEQRSGFPATPRHLSGRRRRRGTTVSSAGRTSSQNASFSPLIHSMEKQRLGEALAARCRHVRGSEHLGDEHGIGGHASPPAMPRKDSCGKRKRKEDV